MKYKYEIHFAYAKEIVMSDLEGPEFIASLNTSEGVENVHGETIFFLAYSKPQYIKQIETGKRF